MLVVGVKAKVHVTVGVSVVFLGTSVSHVFLDAGGGLVRPGAGGGLLCPRFLRSIPALSPRFALLLVVRKLFVLGGNVCVCVCVCVFWEEVW